MQKIFLQMAKWLSRLNWEGCVVWGKVLSITYLSIIYLSCSAFRSHPSSTHIFWKKLSVHRRRERTLELALLHTQLSSASRWPWLQTIDKQKICRRAVWGGNDVWAPWIALLAKGPCLRLCASIYIPVQNSYRVSSSRCVGSLDRQSLCKRALQNMPLFQKRISNLESKLSAATPYSTVSV